jgi:hypothetical protein
VEAPAKVEAPAEVRAAATDPAPDLSATPPSQGIPEFTDVTFGSVALGVAGFASAFLVHEACHVAANLVMGNVPTLAPVNFLGVIPFVAVSPGIQCTGGSCYRRDGSVFGPGPRGYYLIVSSGFLCQAAADEIILTAQPRIRYEQAPFLKGMLLFNTLTSVGYAFANWFGVEPPEGDLAGVDSLHGLPRGLMGAMIFATAALDVARYFLPGVTWLPWVSRSTKVVTLGFVIAF